MTNGEKYKTAQNRADAFVKFCRKPCAECFLHKLDISNRSIGCAFAWLSLEAEEEKPLPCPFCGNKVLHKHDNLTDPKVFVVCPDCGYRSRWEFNLGVAIEAHNRVAKAVAESEAS